MRIADVVVLGGFKRWRQLYESSKGANFKLRLSPAFSILWMKIQEHVISIFILLSPLKYIILKCFFFVIKTQKLDCAVAALWICANISEKRH